MKSFTWVPSFEREKKTAVESLSYGKLKPQHPAQSTVVFFLIYLLLFVSFPQTSQDFIIIYFFTSQNPLRGSLQFCFFLGAEKTFDESSRRFLPMPVRDCNAANRPILASVIYTLAILAKGVFSLKLCRVERKLALTVQD